MKKNLILLAACAMALVCGCAKSATSGTNDSAKRYFDAWVHVQKQEHPEYLWKQTELGSYILEQEIGDGEVVGEGDDSLFVRIEYTTYDLDGTIAASTYKDVNQQIGGYAAGTYYGPEALFVGSSYAGIQEVLKTMKVGGRIKIVIPGWLATYDEYDTAEEYLANCTGDNTIYDFRVTDRIPNIYTWECEQIEKTLEENYPDPEYSVHDTTGFYYIRLQEPTDTTVLRDTTVYINYIGRLLDGSVFDTNIRDTAVRYGLYSSSGSYDPVSITIPSDDEAYSELTMGDDDSSVVKGFARTIWQMGPHEKGVGLFFDQLGYGYSGSGSSIPAYAPLMFEIEIVDEEE